MLAQRELGKEGMPVASWLHFARKISFSLGWLAGTLSKQRPLGEVICSLCSEVGGLVLFLFVRSDLYIAIYVPGVTSWIMLPTPFSVSPDTRVQELGMWLPVQGGACSQTGQLVE